MEDLSLLQDYIHTHHHPNGGAATLHLDFSEVKHLSIAKMNHLVLLFYSQLFSQDNISNYVMGIIHNAVAEQPDFLSFLSQRYPNLQVKVTLLNSREVRTMSISEYYLKVIETFSNGTFRFGNLNQLSLVGCVDEEAGGYLVELLDVLASNQFIQRCLPWGDLNSKKIDFPTDSNDGPILWTRTGEQSISVTDKSFCKRSRYNSHNLRVYRRSDPRELVITDRTNCHLDFSHESFRDSTAAAGVLKAVHCNNPSISHINTEVKHVVCFHPQDMQAVCEILRLDIYEPPATQCIQWVDVGKLNYLRRQGIKYSTITLHDNDAYFIPKNVVHQFMTVSACTSIAWHISMDKFDSLIPTEIRNTVDNSDVGSNDAKSFEDLSIDITTITTSVTPKYSLDPDLYTLKDEHTQLPRSVKIIFEDNNDKSRKMLKSTFSKYNSQNNCTHYLTSNSHDIGGSHFSICSEETNLLSITSPKSKIKKIKHDDVDVLVNNTSSDININSNLHC